MGDDRDTQPLSTRETTPATSREAGEGPATGPAQATAALDTGSSGRLAERDDTIEQATLDQTVDHVAQVPPDRALGAALRPGARVHEYVIQDALARGGFGAVYRAVHRVIGRQVAIKVLHADLAQSSDPVERFVREARAVSSLAHPHIVAIHDFGTLADGRPYQVMELVPGCDLGRLVARRGRLSPARALSVLEPVCLALHAAHERGIVHRDVKASNIMVDVQVEPWTVKLLDFGIAKLLAPGADGWVTSRGRVLGTPQTMAPEQIRGEPVDRRADVYALGVLLFQLLTGRLPFPQREPSLVHQLHLSAAPPAPSQLAPIAPDLDALVLGAMAKQPEQRPASARDLCSALRAALGAPAGDRAGAAPGGGQDAAPRHTMGVGIHVKAELAIEQLQPSPDQASDIEPADDSLLDRLGTLLDFVEDTLLDAGFRLGLATRNAVLAVLPCGPGPGRSAEAESACRRAVALARALAASLRAHEAAHPAITFSLWVHAGAIATCPGRPGRDDDVHMSGPLLDLRDWPRPRHDGQVHTTPAVARLTSVVRTVEPGA